MDFKFGHTYEQFNWGLLRDNQRRVFTIPVGAVPQEEIDEYVRMVATKFRNVPLVNESVSPLDHRFDRDYFLPTRERNPDIPDMVIIDHLSLLRP